MSPQKEPPYQEGDTEPPCIGDSEDGLCIEHERDLSECVRIEEMAGRRSRTLEFRVFITDMHSPESPAGPTAEDLQDIVKEWYGENSEEFLQILVEQEGST